MSTDAISGLGFLIGAWHGAGTWAGAPFTSEARWGRRNDGGLTGLIVAAAGARTRSESVVIRACDPDRRVTAHVTSGPGPAQEFDVQELAAGERYRLLFTPPAGSGLVPQRWSIERTPDGYREVFEIARGGAFERSVECVYTPSGDAT